MSFKEIQGKRNTRLNQTNLVQGAQRTSLEQKATSNLQAPSSASLPATATQKEKSNQTEEKKLSEISPETPSYAELDQSGIEIRTSADKGRGLWATKNIRPGVPIFKLEPHVYCISAGLLTSTCSYCAREDEVRRCTKCMKIAYCSTECQNADWKIHKEECKSLIKWARRAPSESVSIPADIIRVIGRTLWLRKLNGLDSIWWRQIKSMQPNREPLRTNKDSYIHMIHGISLYLMGEDREFTQEDLNRVGLESPNEFISLWSQYTSNSFALTSPTLSAIGVAVSPLAALINHSCNPNAVVVFPRCKQGSPPILNVVAIKPIAPGEEIFASYIDVTLPRQIRLQELAETYDFVCRCSLCESESEDRRQFYFCPHCRARRGHNNNGGGGDGGEKDGYLVYGGEYYTKKDAKSKSLTPDGRTSKCSKCGESVNLDLQTEDVIRVAGEGLVKAESMQNADLHEALRYTLRLLSLLSNIVPPTSHPRLALSRLAQSLLISQLQPDNNSGPSIDQIIRISSQNRDALVQILHEGHPIRAIATAELGQLLCVDEPPASSDNDAVDWAPRGYTRLALAKDILLRARSEVEIGFGSEGSQLSDTIRESLVNITREMDVFKSGVRNVAATS